MISTLYKTDKWLVLIATSVSLLLSLWANIADDVVNNDGIEYIKSARAILEGDWAAAVQTYKWPFYSAIIATISGVSGLSLVVSAYVFNAICYVSLVLAFIGLVRLLGGDRSTLWFAALIILAFPVANKFRPYLIRDPAFLAFFLSGCYAYFLHIRTGEIKHNALAIVCFILGALFRIEGLIYLFASQGYLFGQRFGGQDKRLLRLVALIGLLVVLFIFITWWQFTPTDKIGYASILSQPVQFIEAAWHQVLKEMSHRLAVMESHILVGYSRSYAGVVLLWSAVSIVLLKLIHSLHYLYFILVIVAWKKGLLFPAKELYRPWRFLIFIALLILLGFVLIEWFLSARYPISVALLLLLACPFLLANWYAEIAAGRRQRKFWLVLGLIVLAGIKSLDLATKKHYLKAAAAWMDKNIPQDASVYTNNRIIGHYFGRTTKIDPYWPSWEPFMTGAVLARKYLDYGAIYIEHSDSEYIKNIPVLLKRRMLAKFMNEKGSVVMIFDFSQLPESEDPEPIHIN